MGKKSSLMCIVVLALLGFDTIEVAAEEKSEGIEVESTLLKSINDDERTGYMIYFRQRPDLSPAFDMDWEKRGRFVIQELQSTAERSQAKVRSYLNAQKAAYQAFWIDNVIVVKSSNRATFNDLMRFPEIAAIRARRTMHVIEPVKKNKQVIAPLAIESNISHVNADDVWAMGINGNGMVVANIDTGVHYTHNALVHHYRGNLGGGSYDHDYNWLDPATGNTSPYDDHGHGSHTMGIMIGNDDGTNQIGMAPGAKWIACDACGFLGCPEAALLTCAQWVAAPYPVGEPGSPNPDKRPHVVNNSWGGCSTTYDDWYQGSVDSWHAAGIYPVFANGNASNCFYPEPPGCNTVGNPARYGNVTGVGSTGQSNGQYATHSNWGPTDDPDTENPNGYPNVKPQVLAPGVDIRSATSGSDSSYESWGGTSMSAPHVAGLVALIWQAAPCLQGDYAATETIIQNTATPIPYASDCGGEGSGNVPNNATGWGEINALDAVYEAMVSCGPRGILEGTVTDADSGNTIEGARVEADGFTDFSDTNGFYQMNMPVGTYNVAISAWCYEPQTVTGISVEENVTTVQDFTLNPLPSTTVQGTVTDANTGWPLHAQIDYGVGTVWTDPLNGFFTVILCEGNYNFTVTADGYLPENRVVNVIGNIIENFSLQADTEVCTAPGYGRDYIYDFEDSDAGFTHNGTYDEWEWGTPTTWPNGCASGDRCWGTDLDGVYENNANQNLYSPIIDFSSTPQGTLLFVSWWQALNIENSTWDKAYAEVRINNDPWIQMWSHTGGTVQVDWSPMRYDISDAAGGTVQFRWRLVSDYSITYRGYYIDLVEVGACTPLIECTEDDTGHLDVVGAHGTTGGPVTHTVRIQNAPNRIESMGFETTYNPNVLAYMRYDRGGCVTNFDFFDCTEPGLGVVRCGGFEGGSDIIPAGANCEVVDLQFNVLKDPCEFGTCPGTLSLQELVDDMSGWSTSHGCFCCGCVCDVNGDGQCTPQDALCSFQVYLSICPTACGPCESICCDVTKDGQCTPADALCRFQEYLGIHPNCFD